MTRGGMMAGREVLMGAGEEKCPTWQDLRSLGNSSLCPSPWQGGSWLRRDRS